ncbi:histidine--tRNA ligase, cytoplasmic-like [Centruroides vittatus]|uniref:histidine--tRNA ligase, cytoplasmic-like n=1 Tax=Centruroides vittatus TaxID=120091 RepID=UPI00350F2924
MVFQFSTTCCFIKILCKSRNVLYLNETFRYCTTKSQVKLPKKNISENKKDGQHKFTLRTPKGTKDFTPEQMERRETALKKVINCFKNHGAGAIDTPVFELKEILTEKYGEENKLIYHLTDQGDENLSLRYDLTVPFARFLAMNKISNYKCYHVGKVYRRDSPHAAKGRYREFYQCDFDIAGKYDLMLPDAECIVVIAEILNELNFKHFIIKVNHRKILDGILTLCGVPSDKFKKVCSTIDKLDKISWDDIRKELIEERQLSYETVDMIGSYVRKNGSLEVLEELLSDERLLKIEEVKLALDAMKKFFIYSDIYNTTNKISFDLSLARGLDYYTGIICEAILTEQNYINEDETTVGSVAGGGRYDNLIATLDSNTNNVPCVGISIGLERLFSIMDATEQYNNQHIRKAYTCADVYVASAQKNMLQERMKICKELWDNNIKTEQSYKENPKFMHQVQYCEEHNVPWMIIIGENELQRGFLKLRHIHTRKEVEISRERLIEELKLHLNNK